ncbi:hypothetical protein [Neobacillus vireti]|uniref:Lipoprotein n=1 Tax=Neobacillus vireti LMG 21834 TaxID=1131730 RepID=A0AB94IL57_9BACI|nr:hypothetical protein [Neobacillus vireti]ETI67760.1 hypothetical protein BAVI_15972 [Neobacillus vireti LMG 21834]KLT16112.1 hypothetical protein AA980_19290 [Neobacillus vireti]
MKKILALLLITILALTACTETTKNEVEKNKITNNNYKFIGESEHWKAEYIYKGTETWGDENGTTTYNNKDSYEFVLKYKGSLEELSSMQELHYSYKTNFSSGDSNAEFTEPPKERVFTSGGGSEGGANVKEDEVIHVNVKWDQFEESFELHNKRK